MSADQEVHGNQRADDGSWSRRGLFLAAAGLGAGGALAALVPANADALTTVEAVLVYQNNYRRRHGRPKLATHAVLNRAAQGHANDMARRRVLSHIGTDGSDGGTRIYRAGYAWGAWAENIAAGYTKAADVVAAWYASPGHRTNMLSTAYIQHGAGVARAANGTLYWCVVFARGRR